MISMPAPPSPYLAPEDQTPSFISYVQVKTTLNDKFKWQIPLSHLQAHVHNDAPVFYLLLQLDGDREETVRRAYLAPMDEARIAQILKRMRKAAAKGYTPDSFHKQTVTLTFTEDDALTGPHWAESFEVAVRDHVGTPSEYARRKEKYRQQSGYGPRAHRITVRLNPHDLISHALGDSASVTAAVTEAKTTRFGITLPSPGLGTESLAQPCAVTVGSAIDGIATTLRARQGSREVALTGSLRSPVFLGINDTPPETDRWRFQAGALRCRATASKLQINGHIDAQAECTLQEWRDSAEALRIVCLTDAPPTITLESNGVVYRIPTAKTDPGDREGWIEFLQTIEVAVDFADILCVARSKTLPGSALLQGHEERLFALGLVQGEGVSFSFCFDAPKRDLPGSAFVAQPIFVPLADLFYTTIAIYEQPICRETDVIHTSTEKARLVRTGPWQSAYTMSDAMKNLCDAQANLGGYEPPKNQLVVRGPLPTVADPEPG